MDSVTDILRQTSSTTSEQTITKPRRGRPPMVLVRKQQEEYRQRKVVPAMPVHAEELIGGATVPASVQTINRPAVAYRQPVQQPIDDTLQRLEQQNRMLTELLAGRQPETQTEKLEQQCRILTDIVQKHSIQLKIIVEAMQNTSNAFGSITQSVGRS